MKMTQPSRAPAIPAVCPEGMFWNSLKDTKGVFPL